jgi:hypothetical protein
VKNLVDLNARPDDGFSLCKELKGNNNKLKCYEAVGEQIATLRNDQQSRSAMCEHAEAGYTDVCLFGARVTTLIPPALQKLNVENFGSN